MKTTITTLYGGQLMNTLAFKRPFKLVPNTTINEKLEVQAGIAPSAGELPGIQYICIGNRGHRNRTGPDGQPYTSDQQHQPVDAGLFNFLPFVLVPIDQDLTTAQQGRYAGRKLHVFGGKNYVGYWIRRLDTSKADPEMRLNTVDGKNVSSKPFVPTSDNLNPVPVDISSTEVNTSSGQYVSSESTVEVVFTAEEVEMIVQACRIMYDNEGYAVVSELALVSGVDRKIRAPGNGTQTFDFMEVIAAQICAILSTYHNLPAANNGFKETLNMGITEPMLLGGRASS